MQNPSSSMEPHRALLSGRRPIPPSSNPSLSTGQAFYTVESLQGATVVPPPQLLPPEPLHFNPPPSRPRIPPNERAFGPAPLQQQHQYLERGHPLMGRKQLPPPQLPPPNFVPLMRGNPGMRPLPPQFMMDPRMPGFHPGREPLRGRERDLRRGWGPSRDVDRNRMGRRMDSGRPMQRSRVRKQGQKAKPVPEPKPAPSAATEDEKTPAGEKKSTEDGPGWCSVCQIDCFKAKTLKKHLSGKKHKTQLEIVSGQAEEPQKLDGEDQDMKEVEIADDVYAAAKETVNEETNETAKEEESEQAEAADSSKAASTVAGKKRAIHDNDGTIATRKRSKSTASSEAQNAAVTVSEENLDKENSIKAEKVTDVVEVCELCNVVCPSKTVLETHLKGKKHAARVKKGTNAPKAKGGLDEAKEPAAAGLVKEVEEGANATGELSNGITGQFADVQ